MRLTVKRIPWYFSWKGLLGSKPEMVLLRTRFGIHTFGMRYPIDVVIVDKNCIVQKTRESLLPNRFFFWNPRYFFVLELPKGTIKKKRLLKGQRITLVD